MQNEGKLFQSSYPKSFRDLVGKNGVIAVQGEQQRKLHGIAVNMMRLERLNTQFLGDVQTVMLQTLNSFHDNQVIVLQDVCRKARDTIIRKIKKTIEARRQQPGLTGSNGVLGRLVEEDNLSDDAVADFIINILFAGNETTAKQCSLLFISLINDPKHWSNCCGLSHLLRPHASNLCI